MNLVIDIGNTLIKTSLFRGDESFEMSSFKKNDYNRLIQFIEDKKNEFPETEHVILSSVSDKEEDIFDYLRLSFEKCIVFDHTTKIPIKNLYNSPETLGKDRLAAVVAANNIFENRNVLVIDAGTALTYDFVNKEGAYLGGAISPGIHMRLKALNEFTAQLPLEEPDHTYNEVCGTNTESSILSGVQNGILFELEGFINAYMQEYKDLQVILTGGDAFFFENQLKNEIFADPNLVLKGLNIILHYND